MLEKVISGGQTGADQGGLEAARTVNIPTGGTAPKGYKTEGGPDPSLRDRYGLVEHPSDDYRARTETNVLEADGTVIFGDIFSAGSLLTRSLCRKHKKLWMENPTPEQLRRWIESHKIEVLNVAGNRESENPGIHISTRDTVLNAITLLMR